MTVSVDHKERILDLWRRGDRSGEIAAAIGCTRNVVVGVVYRAREAGDARAMERERSGGRSRPKGSVVRVRVKSLTAPKPRSIAKPVEPAQVDEPRISLADCVGTILVAPLPTAKASRDGVTILDAKLGECRYPVDGAGRDMIVCAESIRDPLCPYCAKHMAIAYNPAPKRKSGAQFKLERIGS